MNPRARPSSVSPTASGAIARQALARAKAAGVDTSLLIRQADLCSEEIADPKARIPARKQVSLLALVADALGDGLLGIHLAAAFEPREVGILYFVLASSGTFGEAVTRVARYVKLANDGVLLHCVRTGGCGLRYTYVGVPRHTDRPSDRQWDQ